MTNDVLAVLLDMRNGDVARSINTKFDDLGGAVDEKLAYSLIRADHKPEARDKVRGKRF